MPDIVSLPEFKAHLGIVGVSEDDTVLTQILDDVEAIYESETGRSAAQFQAAVVGRTEVFDGTGSNELFLDYPIAALTSVKLGYDPAVPDETLNVADKRVVTFGIGLRRLARTDSRTFGQFGQPRYVHVVYNAAADLPANAKLAIKSVAALAYRRRGSEEAKSETIGASTSREMIEALATQDPFWCAAVIGNRRMALA